MTPFRVTVVGGFCMAAAMGIGRFAFTPLLPLMQEAQGLRLDRGAWLATVNYLGYLLGAMSGFAISVPPGRSTRWGVATVAVATFAMAVTSGMPAWLVLRFVAGVASAQVMMGVAGWALTRLAADGESARGGWIFGSVGLSITAVGLVTLATASTVGDPRPAWALLGLASAAIAIATWRPLTHEAGATAAPTAAAAPLDRDTWLLIVCYGVAGFGYIVPATFLPAVARALVNDPAVFGMIWPAFGAAAAASTIGVSLLLPRARPRIVCAVGLLVMAVGTVAPLVRMSLAALAISAVCVGGTFILVTLAGLQEARRIARGSPARAVAGMTASFALGQLAGPLLAQSGASALTAMQVPSVVATVALVASASVLLATRAASPPGRGDGSRGSTPSPSPPPR